MFVRQMFRAAFICGEERKLVSRSVVTGGRAETEIEIPWQPSYQVQMDKDLSYRRVIWEQGRVTIQYFYVLSYYKLMQPYKFLIKKDLHVLLKIKLQKGLTMPCSVLQKTFFFRSCLQTHTHTHNPYLKQWWKEEREGKKEGHSFPAGCSYIHLLPLTAGRMNNSFSFLSSLFT